MIEVAISTATSADLNFVYSSWKLSYRKYSGMGGNMARYNQEMDARIRDALDGAELMVAHDPEDRGYLYGWACSVPPRIIHYVYVKQSLRGAGIAKKLLGDIVAPAVCTHWTKAAKGYAKAHQHTLTEQRGLDSSETPCENQREKRANERA